VTVIATGLGCDASAQLTEMKNAAPVRAATPPPIPAQVNQAINTVNETQNQLNTLNSNAAQIAANLNPNSNTNGNGNGNNNGNYSSSNAGNPSPGAGAESPELARAREIAKRLGMLGQEGQDIDVPAFMRRGQDNTNNA
jgi:hypothetical protein